MNCWKYLKHCQSGLSHLEEKTVCQDYVVIRESENCLAAALADGLGCFANSQVAAEAAAEAVVTWLLNRGNLLFTETQDERKSAGIILNYIRDAVLREADAKQVDVNSMDCNLAFVCIMKETGKAIVGQLGDCAIGLIGKKSGVLTDLTKSFGTASILDKHAKELLRINQLDLDKYATDTIVLTSDGMEGEIYHKGSNVIRKSAQFYGNLLLEGDRAKSLLQEKLDTLVQLQPEVYDDDISLVILSRATKPIELPADPTWLCTCGQRNNILNPLCLRCRKKFDDVYHRLDYSGYSCLEAFFLHCNEDAVMEKRILENQGAVLPSTPQYDNTPMPADREKSQFRNSAEDAGFVGFKVQEGVSVTSDQLAADLQTKYAVQQKREESVQDTQTIRSTELEMKKRSSSKIEEENTESKISNKSRSSRNMQNSAEVGTTLQHRQRSAVFLEPAPLNTDLYSQDEPSVEDKNKASVQRSEKEGSAQSAATTNLHPRRRIDDPQEEQETLPSKKKRWDLKGRHIVIILLVAIIIVLLMMVAGGAKSTETGWYTLDDGTVYSGEMLDGKPQGSGLLKDGPYYWIGTFRDGLKHGRFLVVNGNDPDDNKYVDFENGVESGNQLPTVGTAQESCTVKARSVRLRNAPGYDSRSTDAQIRQNDTVYLTDEETVERDGTMWVQVQTADGVVGWCESEALFLEE